MLEAEAGAYWAASWVWGIPTVVLTVLLHGAGLGLIRAGIERWLNGGLAHRAPSQLRSAFVLGSVVILATVLHAAEAVIWASLYVTLGAIGTMRTAMLYSLSAMTSFGHARLYLAPDWQMLGAIESLNGMMLFGLTTAFLFHIIQQVWSGRFG